MGIASHEGDVTTGMRASEGESRGLEGGGLGEVYRRGGLSGRRECLNLGTVP